MAYFAPTPLGTSRRITPEGFLLCRDTPIARTGSQTYSENELPFRGNRDGQIIVERTPEEVFRPETIASFEGKDVTVEHPAAFITPETWAQHSVGHVQNVRRGSGVQNDLLLADILIKDPQAIAYVNRTLPEISAGYNADYDECQAGTAVQRNIIGNHVALVARGRAGPRVAVRDSISEVRTMQHPGVFDSRNYQRRIEAIRARATGDTLITAATAAELSEYQRSRSGPDLGQTWLGDARVQKALDALAGAERAAAESEIRRANSDADVDEIMSKYGIGAPWKNVMGTISNTDARYLGHLSRDSQAGMTAIGRMNAAAEAKRRSGWR
jgi:hypothetical protein